MTMQRPNVVVYQEYTTQSVAVVPPDLNVLVAGPCYQILDYLDDKTLCKEDAVYGEYHGNCPAEVPEAVTISEPKNIATGALVKSTSVSVYFDEAQVIEAAYATVADDGQYTIGDNLVITHTNSGTGTHLGAAGVHVGDDLIIQSDATDDYVKTVKELCYTFIDKGAALTFITNGVIPGDLVVITNSAEDPSIDGTYTVKRVNSQTQLEVEEVIPGTGDNAADPANCSVTITAANGTIRVATHDAYNLGNWCNVRTTTDFAATKTDAEWRFERKLLDQKLASTDFSVSGNAITIKTAVTIGSKNVSYAKIYLQYEALRQDLQEINDFNDATEIEAMYGKYDARNPLCVGCVVAKANTNTKISGYALASDDLTGYLDFIDKISATREIYTIVPLTYSSSILATLKSMAENLADPNYALAHGTRQKFRMILGAVERATTADIVVAHGGCYTYTSGTAKSGNYTLTLSAISGQTSPDCVAAGVIPGDIITTNHGASDYTYTVAHVKSALVLEVNSGTGDPTVTGFASSSGDAFVIKSADGVTTRVSLLGATEPAKAFTVGASALDALYRVLYMPTAHFSSGGVVPGDKVEMPSDCMVNTWTTYETWTIAEVQSETRVLIVNNGTNSSTTSNELPHYARRGGQGLITQGAMYAKVLRDMTKEQQIDYMLAVATSFGSSRVVLCYPSLVDVTDLVDGSLARGTSTDPIPAESQPGYYLACCVGGQTAGNPSQQGFTFLGVAGIDRIYYSNDYYSEEQLTELSDGGVYVFVQANPSSLPYTIHEVTTDPTSLETGEYMHIKNFDYVAWTFLDVLLPFIGKWNVLPETMEFIHMACANTRDTLKSRYVGKIGAPLTDATIRSVTESTISSDRIEAYIDVDLPMVLNTIGLHLVA